MAPLITRRDLACVLGVAAATATGCAVGGGNASQRAPGPEKRRIRVGMMPIMGAVPLAVAQNHGLFLRHGLRVGRKMIQSGELAVPSLLDGQLQVTFSNHVSLINAYAAGHDLRIIAEGSRARPNNFAVVALPDSSVTSPSDLRGARIGVNALHNIATLTTSSVLSMYGISSEDVTYLEFGFPVMTDVLLRGKVDAAFLPEPFLTMAESRYGVRRLLDPFSGRTDGLPIDGYAVSTEFARDNPNTVRAFQDGLLAAQRISANPSVIKPELRETTKAGRKTAELVEHVAYPVTVNPISLQRVADLMLQAHVLSHHVDMSKMVITP